MNQVYTKIDNPSILRKKVLEQSMKITQLDVDYSNYGGTVKNKEINKLKKLMKDVDKEFNLLEDIMMPIEGEREKRKVEKKEFKKDKSTQNELKKLKDKIKRL